MDTIEQSLNSNGTMKVLANSRVLCFVISETDPGIAIHCCLPDQPSEQR